MWFAVYQLTDGRLLSIGTVLGTNLPDTVGVLNLPDKPGDDEMWDEITRNFIPRPVKVLIDRLDDLQTNPNYTEFAALMGRVQPQVKGRVLNEIASLLGGQRFRTQNEPVELRNDA